MQIIYIGQFKVHSTEAYTAYAFRELGHTVYKLPLDFGTSELSDLLREKRIDFVLFAKPSKIPNIKYVIDECKIHNVKSICWMYDLYFDLPSGFSRKPSDLLAGQDILVTTTPTDYWDNKIKHLVVRQGIHEPEYFMVKDYYDKDVRFIGSMYGDYRPKLKKFLESMPEYPFEWVGLSDEYRGIELNKLLGRTKIIIGDSVPFPKYWSNRLYEVVGRGGFLIMPDIEGIKEEIPSLVTYKYGDFDDLKEKIKYYIEHDQEREELRMICHKEMKALTYKNRVKYFLKNI